MHILNSVLNAIVDGVLGPFSSLAPFWGLAFISLLTGLIMLAIFKFTSNQTAIRRTKDKIKAHFLELRLYKDDLRVTLAAQKHLLVWNLRYMSYSVVPMLFMMVPVVLLLIQLNDWYGRSPLGPDQSATVVVKLTPGTDTSKVALRSLDEKGVTIDTPALRVPEQNEVDWRITAKSHGRFLLELDVDGDSVSKDVVVSGDVLRVPAKRVSAKFLSMIVNPGERPIPKNIPVESIEIKYPGPSLVILGIHFNWLVAFFILSILFGFAFKRPFGVQI